MLLHQLHHRRLFRVANEADTYFKQICDENNVRYIDGNLIKNEILNVSDDDFLTGKVI